MKGDEEGEWTFTEERGGLVIDYVVGNEQTKEGMRKLTVEERMDSIINLDGMAGRGEECKRT